jgi:hypothetical protein
VCVGVIELFVNLFFKVAKLRKFRKGEKITYILVA